MKPLLATLWRYRRVWGPLVVLGIVLVVTFLLLPKEDAPFIYQFF